VTILQSLEAQAGRYQAYAVPLVDGRWRIIHSFGGNEAASCETTQPFASLDALLAHYGEHGLAATFLSCAATALAQA
jgi:hypothetical protein